MAIRTERGEVRTKTTPVVFVRTSLRGREPEEVQLELARLVSSLLHGTLAMLGFNLPASEDKTNTQLMTVWRNPDRKRTNQNARIKHKTTLPYNKVKIAFPHNQKLINCLIGVPPIL